MPDAAARSFQSGFSLVEMLVALALAAVAATVVVGGAMPSGGSLGEEADRLTAHLIAARDRAIMTNRSVRLALDAEGYHEATRHRQGWTLSNGASAPVAWRQDTSFSIDDAGGEAFIVFDPVGLTEPVTIRLHRGGATEALIVSGAGDIKRGGGDGR